MPTPAAVKKFMISENVTDKVNAFVSYSPNATVDGVKAPNVVKEAISPLFLIPVPTLAAVPEGVYIRGICPGIVGSAPWKHYLAFSHQLSLPHFNESIEQDPLIGLTASLPTVSLSLPPATENPPTINALTVLVAASTVAAAAYVFIRRR